MAAAPELADAMLAQQKQQIAFKKLCDSNKDKPRLVPMSEVAGVVAV